MGGPGTPPFWRTRNEFRGMEFGSVTLKINNQHTRGDFCVCVSYDQIFALGFSVQVHEYMTVVRVSGHAA